MAPKVTLTWKEHMWCLGTEIGMPPKARESALWERGGEDPLYLPTFLLSAFFHLATLAPACHPILRSARLCDLPVSFFPPDADYSAHKLCSLLPMGLCTYAFFYLECPSHMHLTTNSALGTQGTHHLSRRWLGLPGSEGGSLCAVSNPLCGNLVSLV